VFENTKLNQLEDDCKQHKQMSKEATKLLGTIESQGLMIRSLKESICREILDLKS
jgi:hypothetical protein